MMKAWYWLFIAVFYMGFVAPDYMDVWLETADVTDIRETFTLE